MKQIFYFTIIFTLLSKFTQGQDDFLSQEKILMDKGRFGEAVSHLVKYDSEALTEDEQFVLYFMLAECHYVLQNYSEEAEYARKVYSLYKDDTEYLLNVAEAYQRAGNIKQAKKHYKIYSRKGLNPMLGEKGLKSCEFATSQLNASSKYSVIVSEELSSDSYDFSASFVNEKKNSLIFTSSRANKNEVLKSSLFFSKNLNGIWSSPVPFDTTLNVQGDIGVTTFDSNRSVLFFTKCFQLDTILQTCDIYSSFMNGELVGEIEKMNLNVGKNVTAGHPTFSNKLNILLFAANLPGGYGGKDIWYSKFDPSSASWGAPINLGPLINTEKDELFPYIHYDNTLYFSSSGHIGMGGLDIFKSEMGELFQWLSPENMKFPINSVADDFSVQFFDNGSGLFTSNRQGGLGKDDIYEFSLINETIEKPILPISSSDSSFHELNKVFASTKELTCPANNPLQSLVVFPNPNDGKFSLKVNLNRSDRFNIRIYNPSGLVVYKNELSLSSKENFLEVSLNNISDGPYFLQIMTNDQITLCEKFIVRH